MDQALHAKGVLEKEHGELAFQALVYLKGPIGVWGCEDAIARLSSSVLLLVSGNVNLQQS